MSQIIKIQRMMVTLLMIIASGLHELSGSPLLSVELLGISL